MEKTKRRKDFDRDVEHVKQVALSRVSGTTTKKRVDVYMAMMAYLL